MELLFVYVKKLPPIFEKETLIKFSNRFNVTLNEDGKSIKIEKNENFIEDFFGAKISNVAALIGRNGAGKSTILDFLTRIFNNIPDEAKYKCLAGYYDSSKSKIFLQYVGVVNSDCPYITGLIELLGGTIDKPLSQQTVFYSPIIDFRNYKEKFTDINYRSKNGDVSSDYLLKTEDDSHRFKNIERQILFVKEKLIELNIETRLRLPKEITLKIFSGKMYPRRPLTRSKEANNFLKLFCGVEGDRINLGLIEKDTREARIRAKKNPELRLKSNQYRIFLACLKNFILHFFDPNYNIGMLNVKKKIGVSIKDFEDKDAFNALCFFLKNQKWTSYTKNNGDAAVLLLTELKKLFESDSILDYAASNVNSDNATEEPIVYINNPEMIIPILTAHNAYQKSIQSFTDHNGSFKQDLILVDWYKMSSGEKAFLDIFSRLYYARQQITDENVKWVYLLIDEGELGFHPEWQREYLDLILEITPKIFKGFTLQIFLTSHSPFVISDLPKDNVIFLKGNIEHGTSIDKGVEIENTFAANIHSLLSSGFFLEKGLIGAFAQRKIRETMKDIKGKRKKSIPSIQKLINIIGEPMIQLKLREMMQEKFPETEDDEIKRLNARIEELNSKKKNKK